MSSRKDGKSGSKGARPKEKKLDVINISDNVVVVVTEEKEGEIGDYVSAKKVPDQSCTFCQKPDDDEMV